MNGPFDSFKFTGVPIIAADGAYNNLINAGIVPDFLVGDLDSAVLNNQPIKSEIIHISNQDSCDIEKCIRFAIQSNLAPCLLTSGFGGEIDHSINNINLMFKYIDSCRMVLFHKNTWSRVLRTQLTFRAETDELISIIPYPYAVVSSQGLKWELNNYEMQYNTRSSTRNRAIAEQVTIKVVSGSVLLVSKTL